VSRQEGRDAALPATVSNFYANWFSAWLSRPAFRKLGQRQLDFLGAKPT